jgi:hypothetical protein
MEEEGIGILAENTKKNNFFRKISPQTKEHEQIIRKRSGAEYVDWTYLA